MQGLRIINKDGAAPTSDEIDAAHRVANTHREMKFGTIKQTDKVKDVEVEYHPAKHLAITKIDGFQYLFSRKVNPGCNCRELRLSQVNDEYANVANPSVFHYKHYAYLTDGTVLATWNSIDDPALIYRSGRPSNGWFGGDYIQLYDEYNDGTLVPTSTVPIVVPEDVCTPPTTPEALSSGNLTLARNRTREFNLACSDAFIARMAIGDMPRNLETSIKYTHPHSAHAKYGQPFTWRDYSNIITIDETEHYQRQSQITLEYSIIMPDETVQVKSETYTGTIDYQLELVELLDFGPSDQYRNYRLTVQYDNYFTHHYSNSIYADQLYMYHGLFPYEVFGGVGLGAFLPDSGYLYVYDPLNNKYLYQGIMCQVSGTRTKMVATTSAGTSAQLLNDFFTNDLYNPGIPPIDAYVGIGATVVNIPDQITTSEFPLFKEFRGGSKPTYSDDPVSQLWLDTRLSMGESVIAYPIQYTSATLGDLGLFPSEFDKDSITGIYLTLGYKFTYSYSDGKLNFAGTVPVKTSEGETIARLDLATTDKNLPNFIFKSIRPKTKLKDVDDLYTDQPAIISGDFDQENITLTGLYDLLQ